VNQELDHLLGRLRETEPVQCSLDDVERMVWQQIAAHEYLAQSARLRLPLQVTAVAAAFLWGVLIGFQVPDAPSATQGFLVEETELLPQDFDTLRL
jgi:hypothetical protein